MLDVTVIRVKCGDSGLDVGFSITNADGTAYDLTGKQATVRAKLLATGEVTVTSAVIVEPPTDGIIAVPEAALTGDVGEFAVEVQILQNGVDLFTLPTDAKWRLIVDPLDTAADA